MSLIFAYDGAEVAFALDATDPEKKPGGYFVHGPGIDNHLAAVYGDTPASGSSYYYHVDGLGSVTAVTNAAGEEVATNRYDSFGKLVAQTGSLPFASPYTYTGREWDAETGLYYYRARYYDPSLGRFISEDPIGFSGGLNFYAYVENNPVRYTDPRGLFRLHLGNATSQQTAAVNEAISMLRSTANSNSNDYFNKFNVDISTALQTGKGPNVRLSNMPDDIDGCYSRLTNNIVINQKILDNSQAIASTLIHEAGHWANDISAPFGELNPDMNDFPSFVNPYPEDGPYGYAAEISTFGFIK